MYLIFILFLGLFLCQFDVWSIRVGYDIKFVQEEEESLCQIIRCNLEEDQRISSVYSIHYSDPAELELILGRVDLTPQPIEATEEAPNEQIRLIQEKMAELSTMIAALPGASVSLSMGPFTFQRYEPRSLLSQFKEHGFTIRNGRGVLERNFDPEQCILLCNLPIQIPLGLSWKSACCYEGEFLTLKTNEVEEKELYAYRPSGQWSGIEVSDALRQITKPRTSQSGQNPFSVTFRHTDGSISTLDFAALETSSHPLLQEIRTATMLLTLMSYGFDPIVFDGPYGLFKRHYSFPSQYFITFSLYSNAPLTEEILLEQSIGPLPIYKFLDTIKKVIEKYSEVPIRIPNYNDILYNSSFIFLFLSQVTGTGELQTLIQEGEILRLKMIQLKVEELQEKLEREQSGEGPSHDGGSPSGVQPKSLKDRIVSLQQQLSVEKIEAGEEASTVKFEDVKSIFPIRIYEKNQVMFSTIRISTPFCTGTGFFWNDRNEKPCLVTNNHVAGYKPGTALDAILGTGDPFFICLHMRDHRSIIVGYALVEITAPQWMRHPNPNIDLCVLKMEDILVEVQQELQKKKLAHADFDDDMTLAPLHFNAAPFFLPLNTLISNKGIENTCDETLSFGDKVSIVGYPTGLADKQNNLPLGCKGSIASDPRVGFQGSAEFLVNVACTGGSSGSPVLSAPPPGSLPKLLGILRAGSGPFRVPINFGRIIMKYRLDEIMECL